MPRAIAVLAAFAMLALAAPLAAQDRVFKPIVIYQGDVRANAYNQAIHQGVTRFVEKTGDPCVEREAGGGAAGYKAALEQAASEGYNPVVVIYGDNIGDDLPFIRSHPQTRFIAFGARIDEPNITALDFAEHEGAFLAGALAAMVSKSKVIGFIAVNGQPLFRRFACGYEQGARYADPEIRVLTGFLGDYQNAWFDKTGAANLADALMDQGADVIFQAAGGAGLGVLDACAARGRLAIGVDVNQNGAHPGNVLTSMIKKTDLVVYAALMQAKRDIWRDNMKTFGLAQDAVGLVFDENNASLVTEDMIKRLDALRCGVIVGKIKVRDYVKENACPMPDDRSWPSLAP